MQKPNLCLEARCLLDPDRGHPDPDLSHEALRFVARSVRRFHVIVWTVGGTQADAMSLKERICQAMVEAFGRANGYVLAAHVRFTHEAPEAAIVVTSARLGEAGGWTALEGELDGMRRARVKRSGAIPAAAAGVLAAALLACG